MSSIESDLANGLRRLAAEPVPGRPPTEYVMREGRRAKRRRVAGVTTAAASAVAIATFAVGAGIYWDSEAVDNPSRGASSSRSDLSDEPRLRLASAAQKTTAGSFRVRVTAEVRARNGMSLTAEDLELTKQIPSAEGALDPVNANGYLRLVEDGRVIGEQRLVAGTLYIGESGRFKDFGQSRSLRFDQANGTFAPSADPVALLSALRTVGEVIESGAGLYWFTLQVTVRTKSASGVMRPETRRVTGEVQLGAAGGNVERIAYEVDDPSQSRFVVRYSIQLSEFGVVVRVEVPPVVG
jgi:hypothetical protein